MDESSIDLDACARAEGAPVPAGSVAGALRERGRTLRSFVDAG
jgi:hypothetical protein